MKLTRLLGVAALLTSTLAFAEDAIEPPQPDPNAGPNADSNADPNAAPAPGRWPRAVVLRPLTLPAGVFMVGADLKNSILNDATGFFDPAIVRVLFGYGITDDIEIGFADYTFATNGAGDGRIAANIGVKVLRGAAGGKLEMIARVQGGYGIGDETLSPLDLGVHVQYSVNDKLVLITPGQQISIGLEDGHASALNLPVALGYQATPETYLQLDTSLAHINLHNDATTAIFADTTPLAITAVYNAMPELDVFAQLGTDLSNDPDQNLTITIGARYYAGHL